MTVRSTYLCAWILTAALGAGCDVHVGENGVSVDVAGGKATEEWSRTYTLAKGGALDISNTNGPIVINAGTGPQVEVKATRTAKASSDEAAQALLKETSITETVTPTHVTLETSGKGFQVGRRSINVEYQVTVPAGLQFTLKTENGGIGLHDADGTFAVSTTNGGIRGTNLSGQVTAHVVNGGIVVDLARVSGPTTLDTVNGGIRVNLPADANVDVEASAVNGGVSSDNTLNLTGVEKSRQHMTGKLNSGGTKITATTVNGGVRLVGRSISAQTDKEAFDEAGPIIVEKKLKQ